MSRFDAIGLFWEDLPTTRKGGRTEGPMPSIPETGWIPPTSLPNLDSAVVIALDTETFDPELKTNGPGWARGVGHIVGVSLAARDAQGNIGKWYFPIRHETMKEHNMDPDTVLPWLAHTLGDPNQPKVGANIQYDIGWLRQEGVEVKGPVYDVQFAEALLDEAAKVELEILGQKYLNEGKESNLLYEWLSDWFGGAPNGNQRKHIYRAPPSLVGPYAESDADLPLRLMPVLYQQLAKEGLTSLFDMECRLIRMTIDMRFAGVRVDLNKAEKIREDLLGREVTLNKQLKDLVGFEVNVNANDSLAAAFNEFGLSYKRTAPSQNFPEGKPSFTKQFLEGVEHPLADIIREIRRCEKLRGTFIESYILDANVDGFVYGSFNQLRGEGGGTRSGRFSASNPNLQNIPSRDEELAPLIRSMFIPDEGHVAWRKYDYSQIEYRLLIHYAIGTAGDAIRKYFWENPETDYHDYAQALVQERTGLFIDRKPIKNINFGLIYGMGPAKLARGLGMSLAEGKKLMEAYFLGVPFAKPTMDAAMQEAQKLGVITTILNRKSRFDLWEPAKWGTDSIALPYDKALRSYGGNIQRAYTHKALNRRLQGTAADLMKMAMLKCYEDGVFDITGIPRLTVHDELDFSDPGGKSEAFNEMQHIMETAIQFNVPVKADGEIGPDWGHVKDLAKLSKEEKVFFEVD